MLHLMYLCWFFWISQLWHPIYCEHIYRFFFLLLSFDRKWAAPASMPFHKSTTSHLYSVSSPHTAQWKEKWYPWGCLWLISWSCLTFTAHNSIKLWGLLRKRACSLMCNTNKFTLSPHAHTHTHKHTVPKYTLQINTMWKPSVLK